MHGKGSYGAFSARRRHATCVLRFHRVQYEFKAFKLRVERAHCVLLACLSPVTGGAINRRKAGGVRYARSVKGVRGMGSLEERSSHALRTQPHALASVLKRRARQRLAINTKHWKNTWNYAASRCELDSFELVAARKAARCNVTGPLSIKSCLVPFLAPVTILAIFN